MRTHARFHVITCALVLTAVLLPQGAVGPPPRALASGDSPPEPMPDATTGAWAVRNPPPGLGARDEAVALVLDDGGAESNIGVLLGQEGPSIQFIWLNRFTPDPSAYPLVLNQIQVLFDETENTGTSVGNAIDLVVYADPDGNPANGAVLLATLHETVRVADGDTWSVYDLATPVSIENPGDVLLGVINRFVTTGVTPTTYPARQDTTSSRGRSWLGWWSGDPPDPATLPTDSTLDVADNMGLPGNWMIRGYGAVAAPDNWLMYLPVVSENAGPPASPPVLDGISNPDGDGTYSVSWSAVSRASSYTLEEDTDAAFSTPRAAYSGSDTSETITGQEVGTYYYRVRASNAWGTSGWSNVESVNVSVPPPASPEAGSWSGTTDEGYPISFTVVESAGYQVQPLKIKYSTNCFAAETTFRNSIPISDNHFDTGGSTPRVIGDFTTGDASSGTWSYSAPNPNGPGWCSGSGTWTASYSPPTPPDDADLPCLFAVNWWRRTSPPYDLISSTYTPACLAATDVTWEPVIGGNGSWTGYHATVTRQDKQNFDMDATYTLNSGGGVEGADVVKNYAEGSQYQMEIVQFCPTVGELRGYRVRVDGQLTTVGICP